FVTRKKTNRGRCRPAPPTFTKNPPLTGSMTLTNPTGMAGLVFCRAASATKPLQHRVWRERGQFRRVFARVIGTAGTPSIVDSQVAADGPAQFLQSLCENRVAGLVFPIIHRRGQQHSNTPHTPPPLRGAFPPPTETRRARGGGRAAPPRLPPPPGAEACCHPHP